MRAACPAVSPPAQFTSKPATLVLAALKTILVAVVFTVERIVKWPAEDTLSPVGLTLGATVYSNIALLSVAVSRTAEATRDEVPVELKAGR
jgi:hypothetical protein